MNYNLYTLHTKADSNCTTDTFPPRKYSTSSAGRTTGLHCGSAPNANSGCNYVEDDPSSYGEGLNAAAGATFAMLWETTGIRICQSLEVSPLCQITLTRISDTQGDGLMLRSPQTSMR